MVPWESARPLQFRTDTLFPPEKSHSILASFLINKKGLTVPASRHMTPFHLAT